VNLLTASDSTTQLLLELGINDWESAKSYVQHLPYGRNKNRSDLSLVIKEKQGTCSSKHAFLKKVADHNQIQGISLMLCLYKMNMYNTPGIGTLIKDKGLEYLPEAHCFIIDNRKSIDLTSSEADITTIVTDIIEELEIEPYEINHFKVNYHKDYLMQWIIKERITLTFNEVWTLREQCIQKLSTN